MDSRVVRLFRKRTIDLVLASLLTSAAAQAEPPHTSYIFPAGGQRGTKVTARVGGHYLHDRASFEMLGAGVTAPAEIRRTETIWFDGPLIRLPASQQPEDYPQDYAAELAIAADAPLGKRWWRCWNAQGVTSVLPFVVGELPEVVEAEIDGEALPVAVSLPVTINGRIFPREDIDVWTFEAQAGQAIDCSVMARELGSPLAAKLSIHDAGGALLAESTGGAATEARLRIVAAKGGRYALHITDVAAGGLQHYVYRLTVTAGSTSSTGQTDLAGQAEIEPNEMAAAAQRVTTGATISGRIQAPGDVDCWLAELRKGQPITFESRGAPDGSPLALVLSIKDNSGRQLAQLDASEVNANTPSLSFTPPNDAAYLVEIRERFARRGGPEFTYQIAIDTPRADFRLYAADSIALDVGGEKKLDVQIERLGNWKGPLTLHVDGLPAGVTCGDVQVQANANKASLLFKCGAGTPVVSALLTVVGRGEIDGKLVERLALLTGQKDGFARGQAVPVRLATTLPTPFKFSGQYSLTYAQRGGVLRKRYTIDRGGFAGPLEARLADRQGRHLQGVTGEVVAIPAGATEFEYPLRLPPWMELGRTSRTNLMLAGELKDAAGVTHKVCFTTREQNEQLIALVTASALRLSLDRSSAAIEPNSELAIPIEIKRAAGLDSPVRVELIVPPHMRDISATAVEAPPGADAVTLRIQLGTNLGPLNIPLTIRASGQHGGETITAEAPLDLLRLERH